MMKGLWLGLVVGITFTCLLGQWVFSAASKETDSPKGISPEIVAEYVHSVVQADRAFYQTEVVDRMREKGMVSASEHWRVDGGLPLPAQFLQESGQLMAKQGKAIRFRLISSWAINKRASPNDRIRADRADEDPRESRSSLYSRYNQGQGSHLPSTLCG